MYNDQIATVTHTKILFHNYSHSDRNSNVTLFTLQLRDNTIQNQIKLITSAQPLDYMSD